MSEWRDRCEHGCYEGHLPDGVGLGDYMCPGGRLVTDANIMARAAKLADYEAAFQELFDRAKDGRLYNGSSGRIENAHAIVAAALGVDDE